jgi:hypothetical protein
MIGAMSTHTVARATSGYAIASLVLGIAGVSVAPLVGSILAVAFGKKAQDEIRRGAADGEGLATAGIVLGWVGIALLAVAILPLLLWLT